MHRVAGWGHFAEWQGDCYLDSAIASVLFQKFSFADRTAWVVSWER